MQFPPFDTFAMVDWSGGNDTGPRPRRDAIWLAVNGGESVYIRNRILAEEALCDLIEGELTAGRRLFLGFDFSFAYPMGFARALTGQHDPLHLWDWITDRIEDSPRANNRFDLAGQINQQFGGQGPFWGNGLKRDIPGLPRNKRTYANPFPDWREGETHAKGFFTSWQLAGAGAVGSQVLMGVPVLTRLRRRFPSQIAAWPFEPLDRSVAFIELWPSLIRDAVARAEQPGDIRDAVQVQTVTRALGNLDPAMVSRMLDISAPVEGWIFGLGFESEFSFAAGCHRRKRT